MDRGKVFDLIAMTSIRRVLIEGMPDDFYSRRELRIQNEKLWRMILTHGGWPGSTVPLGKGSIKIFNKDHGRKHAEIGRQAKKVEKMLDEAFRKSIRAKTTAPMTNAQFRVWKNAIDRVLQRMVKQQKAEAQKLIERTTAKLGP